MEKLIYLASPFAHNDPKIRRKRLRIVTRVAVLLLKEGNFVYSPLTHNFQLVKYGLELGWDFWKKHDSLLLSKCNSLFILVLDGWKDSKGIKEEIKIAKKMKIPIYLINENLEIFRYKEGKNGRRV